MAIGFDPAPLGQVILKKALCDSDFDGCVSAAILKEVYPDLKLYFTDPGSVQEGKFDDWVDEFTVIADLPYVKGIALYFDHHLGNRPEQPVPGRWENRPSAAEIVLEYFRGLKDLSKYERIVYGLGKFDSGCVNREDLTNPGQFMRLGLAIDRKDNEFQKYFSELLALHSWEEVLQDRRVREKLEQAKKEQQEYREFVSKNTEIINGIAFLDHKGYRGAGGHSYYVSLLFPKTRGIVLIKYEKQKVKFNLFHNTFNFPRGVAIDFLSIARKINPKGSGGHKGACGFTLPEGMSSKEAVESISELAGKS